MINLGPFDITMTFQQISEIVPGQGGVSDLVSVVMSPQHFKGFVRAAIEVLSAYETSFGQLALADQDTKPTRTAADMERQIQAVRAAFQASQPSIEPPPPSKRSRGASRKKAPEL
jgi:hypothetical protein